MASSSKLTKAAVKSFFDQVRQDHSVQVREALVATPKLLEARGDKGRIAGSTPLLYSLRCTADRTTRVLINHGANANARITLAPKWTCLMWSIGYWIDLEIVELLLQNGADPNRLATDHEFALKRGIELAVAFDGLYEEKGRKAVELLLEYGADLDLKPKRKIARSAREQIQYWIDNDRRKVPRWMKKLL